MPKLKSHGGISKKIKVRPGGTTKIGFAGTNHNTGKKPSSFSRRTRKGSELASSFQKKYKGVM